MQSAPLGVESALQLGHMPAHSPHRRKAAPPRGGAWAVKSFVPPEALRGGWNWGSLQSDIRKGAEAASPRPPEGGAPSAQAPGLTEQAGRLGALLLAPPEQFHQARLRATKSPSGLQKTTPSRRAGLGAGPSFFPSRWSPSLPACSLLTPVQTLWPLLPHLGLPSPHRPLLSRGHSPDALGPTCLPGSEPLTCSPPSLCPCSLPPEGRDLLLRRTSAAG